MRRCQSDKGVPARSGLGRRDFLKASGTAAGSAGLVLSDLATLSARPPRDDLRLILLFLVGGPSQLDTWDPKPNAPSNVRGPFRPIQTTIPGVQIAETFPLMAQRADRYALVRSVHHRVAPIHETGHQLMQTGHLFRNGRIHPHCGSVVSLLASAGRQSSGPTSPPFVILPGPITSTGIDVSHGQEAGYLGEAHEPFVLHGKSTETGLRVDHVSAGRRQGQLFASLADRAAHDLASESSSVRDRYGRNSFGQSCLVARQLVESGVRVVTVNMFDTVFDKVTWDCHADGGSLPATLADYRHTLCPMFDRAYSSLLDDLHERGMLSNTLVVAMGEFGRTPYLNARGGRDHWPGVWSILLAGAGIRGGQVVGASDRIASEPSERPVTPAEVAATLYHALGIDPLTRLPGSAGPLVDAEPIRELFV